MTPSAATGTAARRRYRSPLREERSTQTRRAIVGAAHELFTSQGWAGTGIRDIAAKAGVAVETVYSHFASKPGVLRAVANAAVVGDDAPVPLAERAEFRAIGAGSRQTRIRAAARVVTAVHVRTAPFFRVLREAAATDGDIGEMLESSRERRRQDVGAAVELIIDRRATRTEVDGVWAVTSPEVYLLLVETSGWTSEEYEAWVTATLERILPRS